MKTKTLNAAALAATVFILSACGPLADTDLIPPACFSTGRSPTPLLGPLAEIALDREHMHGT